MNHSILNNNLKIRIPAWNRNQVLPGDLYSYLTERDEKISLSVNGDMQQVDVENGYLILDRDWEGNTSIILNMDMPVFSMSMTMKC
ncbi:MAG: glycoside hydrolase family 127 protein [Bacteroidales bacterium]|nr:glycoside hydrolase family 127 protein [Bacteroidales bacterium]